jgi:hypothetical protein
MPAFILLNFTRIITFPDLSVFCVKKVTVGAGKYRDWIEGFATYNKTYWNQPIPVTLDSKASFTECGRPLRARTLPCSP